MTLAFVIGILLGFLAAVLALPLWIGAYLTVVALLTREPWEEGQTE